MRHVGGRGHCSQDSLRQQCAAEAVPGSARPRDLGRSHRQARPRNQADHGSDEAQTDLGGRYRRNHAGGRQEPEQFRSVPGCSASSGAHASSWHRLRQPDSPAQRETRPPSWPGGRAARRWLSDLTGRPAPGTGVRPRYGNDVAAVSGLLEAIRCRWPEGGAMPPSRPQWPSGRGRGNGPSDARGSSHLAALALLTLPRRPQRLVDPRSCASGMLDDTFTRISDTLDIDHPGP